MSGTLLNRRASHLAPLWRDYWGRRWHKIPAWPAPRLAPLLTAAAGRMAIKEKERAAARLPLVTDYPRGIAPFLGVMTLGDDGGASRSSGILEFPMAGHLLTVAPTRTGKGTSHIIPNLLLYGGSCLVIDVKGENYDITADRRRQMFPNSKVFKFAPLEDNSSRYNPLDFIRTEWLGKSTADTYADTRLLSDMLLPTKPREEYWDVESRNLLTLLLLYVAVRYDRNDPQRSMRTLMGLLFPTDGDDTTEGLTATLKLIGHYARAEDEPLLAGLASSFLEHEPKVFSNIISNCRAGMQTWLSPRLLNATDASDFEFSDLKAAMCRPLEENPAPASIYVVIPPQHLREYRGVVRMMVGLSVAELTRAPKWAARPGWRTKPPCDVLFLLDELPILGYMGPIVDGLAFLAGYGIQIWSFVQNIGQLKEVYRDEWHNFTANAGAMSFFGVNDPDTADYVARLLGETAEYRHAYTTYGRSVSASDSSSQSTSFSGYSKRAIEESGSHNDSQSTTIGISESATHNVRFVREPIARAADIRAIDPDLQFIFIRNTPPILATKMPYFDFPLFTGLHGSWSGGARA
jgi:type IV secretory pathway TraG/TraD family ATPase VirD4